MVEHNKTVVKAGMAVGQFKIVDGVAREFRLGEIFKIITPITETAAERKRQVDFIKQFATRHERIEGLPRIAKLDIRCATWGVRHDFAARTAGTEREKRICRNE